MLRNSGVRPLNPPVDAVGNVDIHMAGLIYPALTINPSQHRQSFLLPRYQTYIGGVHEKLPAIKGWYGYRIQRWNGFGKSCVLPAIFLGPTRVWGWKQHIYLSNRQDYTWNENHMLHPDQSSLMRNKLWPTKKSTDITHLHSCLHRAKSAAEHKVSHQ